MPGVAQVLNIIYLLILYPLIVVGLWIFKLLSWTVAPVIYLGHPIIYFTLLPINFLVKFEVI